MTERKSPIMGSGTNGTGRGIVEVSRELSLMNDQLFRQCRNYSVRFSIIDDNTRITNTVKFFTLADNWFNHGAIKHAYANWLKSLKDKVSVGAVFGKWYDWRIEAKIADGVQRLGSCTASLQGAGNPEWTIRVPDEYEYSHTRDSAGNEMGFAIGDGDSSSSEYDIQLQYQKSLTAKQADDNTTTSEASYANLHDASDHLITDHMVEAGDKAPYDLDRETALDGVSPWVMKAVLHNDRDGGTSNTLTPFFNAPLGIVLAVQSITDGDETDFDTDEPSLWMEAQKGSYKGVKADAIVDFNPRQVEKLIGRA